MLNARGATLADGKLTLTGASPSSIVFADRPVCAAGHIETAQFIETWLQGEDKFNVDPPNAAVSALGPNGSVADAVVTISAPVIEGDTLAFAAGVLKGALTGATGPGPAPLFISRGGFGGFHGGGGMEGRRLPWRLWRGRAVGGGADHFSNYAHVQNPHATWYGSDDGSKNRTVNYDPQYNNNYHRDRYYDGGCPWGAGVAGFAAGPALGAADNVPYLHPYCGYPPYPPCN